MEGLEAPLPLVRRETAAASRPAVELGLLAAAAALGPFAGWAYWTLVLRLPSNDFHDYWLAGRLVAQGRSPYDLAALEALARAEHLGFLTGGGYSYPLPFAVAMAPLAALPFPLALAVFVAVSIVVFGLTVAAWIGWAHGWTPELRRRRVALALAAGIYPPVYGTIAMGQANLLVLMLIAIGAVLTVSDGRVLSRLAGGALLGLAAVVKLVPAVLAVPLWLGRRFGAVVGLVGAAALAVGAATLIAPAAAAGSGSLGGLFDADAFYTNQSLNGFVTRLVTSSDRTLALWPGAFEPGPVMLGLTAVFGLATLAVLWHCRGRLASRAGLALGLGFALVAATVGAPKDSFWNEALVLVPVGLLLAVEAPNLRFSRFDRADRLLLGFWLAATFAWTALWAISPSRTLGSAPLEAAVTVLESASLYGLLALWLVFARRLGAVEPGTVPAPAPAAVVATSGTIS